MPKTQAKRKISAGDRGLINLLKEINMEPITLECTQSVFDLDTKSDITLFKQGTFTPATNAQEALAAVGNDSETFLKVINAGLRDFVREQLSANESVAWQAKDEEGNLVPFSGTTISEEKSKQLAANVLNMAKMVFGYAKEMGRDEKRVAKDKAQDMLLSNPAVLASLKG